MTAGRRRLLLLAWAMLVFGLCVRALGLGLLREGATASPILAPIVVDLNRASIGELTALPGIGPARAEAIVLDRIRHGPFRVLEDLDRVDGFGAETCGRIRPYVVPRSRADDETAPR